MPEMKTFNVVVCGKVLQLKELEIQACNLRDARRTALEIAPNQDFCGLEKDSEYTVADIWEVYNG